MATLVFLILLFLVSKTTLNNKRWQMKRKSNSANKAYKQSIEQANVLVEELKERLKRHQEIQKQNTRDWGYAGDIDYIIHNLNNMLDGFCE
jgi:hypothetical protein